MITKPRMSYKGNHFFNNSAINFTETFDEAPYKQKKASTLEMEASVSYA
jgi:hypothetical protein